LIHLNLKDLGVIVLPSTEAVASVAKQDRLDTVGLRIEQKPVRHLRVSTHGVSSGCFPTIGATAPATPSLISLINSHTLSKFNSQPAASEALRFSEILERQGLRDPVA
jgi:hypothetical protein